MPRGRKPKSETLEEVTEVVETVEKTVEDTETIVEEKIDDTVEDAVSEEVVEETVETPIEETVEEVVEPIVETPSEEAVEGTKEVFNADVEIPTDSLRTLITVKNFTTVYRDASLKYPMARIYGVATLIDFVNPKILKVRAMFNGTLIVGYIERGSIG